MTTTQNKKPSEPKEFLFDFQESPPQAKPAEQNSEFAELAFQHLSKLSGDALVDEINAIRKRIHDCSPFKQEPVDLVLWVKSGTVKANDYNPNSVAPPEMELLRVSISEDGYTQPIVTFDDDDTREVVDGFHRHRVGKECAEIQSRINGYLPVVTINEARQDKGDRIASTIRHNRARGKHKVDSMSDIVVELKRRNWSNEKIGKNLGMDEDEILRLCQITGLADIFSDQDFSRSWDVEGEITEGDFEELSEEIAEESEEIKTANTSDEGRIFHTFENWECYKAGFYSTTPPNGMTKTQCHQVYAEILRDTEKFELALQRVISEWSKSCEHYLTNRAMNRIAWLGQASLCIASGISSEFRSGWQLLTEMEQHAANLTALKYLNKWLESKGRPAITLEEGFSGERQSNIY